MQNEQPYKLKVSVSLDEDVIKQIKILAEKDDRNFSQYINLVLKNHIKKQENR
ncbi:MAG: toxin-antitoxin system protein [Faecalibacterium sp.]